MLMQGNYVDTLVISTTSHRLVCGSDKYLHPSSSSLPTARAIIPEVGLTLCAVWVLLNLLLLSREGTLQSAQSR